MSDRVLVTGGSGFIGSWVVELLLAAGHEVTVLDLAEPRGGGTRFVRGDLRNQSIVDAAVVGVDLVIHLAAKVGLGVDVQEMPAYCDSNVTGTATLLAAMSRAGIGRLVLASSMVVYGEGLSLCAAHGPVRSAPRRPIDLDAGVFEVGCPHGDGIVAPTLVSEDAQPDPRSAYAVSKLAQEQLAAVWALETGSTAAALRYHNVYGPGLPRDTPYAGVAAIFCSALVRGKPPRVFEDGRQRRDFVHVRDVAAANVAALRASLAAGSLRTYNIGSGTPRTIGDLAAALAAAVDGPQPVVTGEYRLGDVRHVTASSARARAELGWRAGIPFRDGVEELARELIGSQETGPTAAA